MDDNVHENNKVQEGRGQHEDPHTKAGAHLAETSRPREPDQMAEGPAAGGRAEAASPPRPVDRPTLMALFHDAGELLDESELFLYGEGMRLSDHTLFPIDEARQPVLRALDDAERLLDSE